MSDTPELSLSDLRREFTELRKDYEVFVRAYDTITQRIAVSSELQPPRNPLLHSWSGSRAVCGSLELSIHSLERVLHEYDELIRMIDMGEIRNSDRPPLTVVDGGIE